MSAQAEAASREFNLNIDAYLKRVGVDAEVAFRNVANRVFNNVVRLTPVDTGWARANWYVTINTQVDIKPGPSPTKRGVEAFAPPDPSSMVVHAKVGDTLWLQNGVPYIGALEDGWSQQAPYGMVKVAVASAQAFIETYARGS